MRIACAICFILVWGEGTSETQKLKKFMENEMRLLEHLMTHIQEKATVTENIERRLNRLLLVVPREDQREEYLSNPLTAMVMVRRLAEDWAMLAKVAGGQDLLEYLELDSEWPTRADVTSTVVSLIRSQITYKLDTDQLASGILGNYNVTTSLAAADCFSLAKEYYRNYQYAEALAWLKQTLGKISSDDSTSFHQEVLQHLVTSMCFLGDSKRSRSTLLAVMKDFRELKPPYLLANDYMRLATKNCTGLMKVMDKLKLNTVYKYNSKTESAQHERLCQAQVEEQTNSELRCRYVHYHKPYLRFQPFKLEELQLEPPVVRFHEVITDLEAKILIGEAMIVMEKSTTLNLDGSRKVTDYRRSQTGWLYMGDSVVSDRLTRRSSDMTGIDASYSQENQMCRYSVGGEYRPHKDYFGDLSPFQDDRLATLMYYLNDVKQGGRTIFLKWGLSVPPIKNSAILWFNEFPRGEGDATSTHSGCPVLQGSKWVLNKWFLNAGNEFKVPCHLNINSTFKNFYM